MIFDWIAREGWIVFNWWLLVSVMGLAALPVLLRLLGGLPDRGYTLAKPAGVLLTTFVFWLLASLGFLTNTTGSILLAWLIVAVIALAVYLRAPGPFDLRAWWQENRRLFLITELLFIVLLVSWSVVRAHQNNLNFTEKPMDLAFMSAVQRSETFPPNDPWLSGYSISYYYFGYVMAAMLSEASGVWSTTGYNMHIAMLFALAGVAAFGVTYNLVRSRARPREGDPAPAQASRGPSQQTAVLFGLLGMVFVVLMGNFHTALVELPYSTRTASAEYLAFWDTKGRNSYEGVNTDIAANLLDSSPEANRWWWFDAARAMRDRTLDGGHLEVIVEFPAFSFLLADSHPHVMALPYVLLAMGLALNVALSDRRIDGWRLVFYGVIVGGLLFLNTWDAPIYIVLLVGAEAMRRARLYRRLTRDDWADLVLLGAALVGVMLVAYLPFLVGFRSQLGGVLPNIQWPTRTQQLFITMGPFLLLLTPFLLVEAWRARQQNALNLRFGLLVSGGVWLALAAVFTLFLILGALSPSLRDAVTGFAEANGGWGEVLPEIAARRLNTILTPLLLLAALALVVARLFAPRSTTEANAAENDQTPAYPLATGFALLAVAAGAGLILIPEFVFLRDVFNHRMNTVFKFYYQAWVLFSIASAYGLYTLLADSTERRPAAGVRYAVTGLLVVVLAAGLLYPILGNYNRMFVETSSWARTLDGGLTLDGGPTVVRAEDYPVLMCLHDLADGDDVIAAEASGGSYDFYNAGRTGALTGIPTVLGWEGHQSQWRGTGFPAAVGSRRGDLQTLYADPRIQTAAAILQQYNVDYIVYGPTERERYGAAGGEKFLANFEVVCESPSGLSRVYRVDPSLVANLVNSR